MKVYNIRDSKKFFEHLAGCKGAVELVNEEGMHLTVIRGKEKADLLPMTYMDGEIKQMELVFERREDCHYVMSYLINLAGYTA